MKNLNPFMPGDRVVCIADSWEGPGRIHPRKGEVLTVDSVVRDRLSFEKFNTDGTHLYLHTGFAPAQEAGDMEFEDTEVLEEEEIFA